MPPRPPEAAAGSRRIEAALCLALGIAVLGLAGARLADHIGDAGRSLDERLATAPASAALWLRKAEQEEDPKALRLSILAGPREPALAPRQRALADRLGARLDTDTRELLK
jgi:hypothetical protein